MRRSREHAAETRRRAVAAAAALYRERGLDAVSVHDVMGAIGMTAGGFYRHFDSKDALAVEACSRAFDEAFRAREAAAAASGEDPLAAFVGRYLSRAHRDAPARGCPVPALLSSAPRQSAAVRRVFTDAIQRILAALDQLSPGAARDAQLAAVAGLVGALALSRAVDDEELSRRLLHEARGFWIRTLGGRGEAGAARPSTAARPGTAPARPGGPRTARAPTRAPGGRAAGSSGGPSARSRR